jgi:hypothetical protein
VSLDGLGVEVVPASAVIAMIECLSSLLQKFFIVRQRTLSSPPLGRNAQSAFAQVTLIDSCSLVVWYEIRTAIRWTTRVESNTCGGAGPAAQRSRES